MASKAAVERLKKEYRRLQKEPVEFIEAVPNENDLLDWHYVIRGPPETPYHGGVYHGKLTFPKQYPYKPPSIVMLTPNGRFKTNTRLCLSMSDFHPETWNPLWSTGTILSGVLSFMLESAATYGSMDSTDEEKRRYATASMDFNLRNKDFVKLFPHLREAPLPSSSSSINPGEEDANAAPLLRSQQTLQAQVADARREQQQRAGTFDKLIIGFVVVAILYALSHLYT